MLFVLAVEVAKSLLFTFQLSYFIVVVVFKFFIALDSFLIAGEGRRVTSLVELVCMVF